MLKPIKFKKSFFGGFNRQSVMNYINDLYNSLSSMETENNDLRQEIAALQSDNMELGQEVSRLRKNSQIDAKICPNIPNDALENDYDTIYKNDKEVHNLSLDIGNILKAARECADNIIREAEDKSKELKDNAVKNSETLMETLERTQLYISALSNDLREAVDDFEQD